MGHLGNSDPGKMFRPGSTVENTSSLGSARCAAVTQSWGCSRHSLVRTRTSAEWTHRLETGGPEHLCLTLSGDRPPWHAVPVPAFASDTAWNICCDAMAWSAALLVKPLSTRGLPLPTHSTVSTGSGTTTLLWSSWCTSTLLVCSPMGRHVYTCIPHVADGVMSRGLAALRKLSSPSPSVINTMDTVGGEWQYDPDSVNATFTCFK